MGFGWEQRKISIMVNLKCSIWYFKDIGEDHYVVTMTSAIEGNEGLGLRFSLEKVQVPAGCIFDCVAGRLFMRFNYTGFDYSKVNRSARRRTNLSSISWYFFFKIFFPFYVRLYTQVFHEPSSWWRWGYIWRWRTIHQFQPPKASTVITKITTNCGSLDHSVSRYRNLGAIISVIPFGFESKVWDETCLLL